MHIVFPDASSNIKEVLTKDLTQQLENVADLSVYEGVPKTKEEFFHRIKDADGIILGKHLPNDVMSKCEKLKIISFVGYGIKNYVDIEFATEKGIILTNTPSYGDSAVAEHALALLLALTKNIVPNHCKTKKGMWDKSNRSIELKEKTIGLIGMGGIGQRMSEYCKALGMNVIGWTFNPTEERSKKLGVPFVNLEEVFTKSDFISLHLPYTDMTKGIIGKNQFSLLKPDAILINTARAELIDRTSLINSLLQKRLAGAGLDVFDNEPIPKNDPLLKMDNVIISPHVGYNTPESIENMMKISIDNITNYIKGNLQNVVDM